MKKVLITMLVFFAFTVWPFGGIWQLLANVLGGGVEETFLYPLYGGIILLSGLIVGCTELILEELKELRSSRDNTGDKHDSAE